MKELTEYLSEFITENKRLKIEQVLAMRTRHLTVAVEDVYQPHNASAVVRTCDSFGLQEMHIIENRNKYRISTDVASGSAKWVDLIQHNKEENNTIPCIKYLKSRGYKVIATTPHNNDVPLAELDITSPIALLFGNEQEGLSKEAIESADGFVKIPMFGFTESLNISVSAAICMHALVSKLHTLDEKLWKLSEEEKLEIRLRWIKSIVKRSDILEKDFLSKKISN